MPGLRLGVPGKAPGRLRQPEWNLATNLVELTASEPPVVRDFASTTTASFTVPANSLVVATLVVQSNGTASVPTATITDSGAHTWTQGAQAAVGAGASQSGGLAGVYYSYFSAAATVTVNAAITNGNTVTWRNTLGVYIFQGAAISQVGAGSGTATLLQGASQAYATLTTTTPGSIVIGAIEDTEGSDDWYPNGNSAALYKNVTATGENTTIVFFKSRDATGAPGAASIGGVWTHKSGVASANTVAAALEILPATQAAITATSPRTVANQGGTSVTIGGYGFTAATAVTFAGVAATSFTVDSDTQITAVAPATTTAGQADVRVTVGGYTTNAQQVTYQWFLWGDEFNGTSLDTTMFQPYGPGPGFSGNGQRLPGQISVGGGFMRITCDTAGNSGGMQADSWGLKYGTWEARVRCSISTNANVNPILILWPSDGNWPTSGEVDYMECGDGTRQSTSGFLHYSASNLQTSSSVAIDLTQWQVFTVVWTPTSISYYVNGLLWFLDTDLTHLPPGPMNPTIQLDYGGGTIAETVTMDVDWFRVYWPTPAAIAPPAALTLTAPAGIPTIDVAQVAQPQWLPPPPLRWMLEGHPVRPQTGTQFVFTADPALISLVAPAGTASIAAAGPVSNINLAAPAGNGSTTASGPVSNINLAALAGSANTSAAGVVSNISLAALAGSASIAVLGPVSNINLVAPAGTGIISAQGVAANIALAALAGNTAITAIGAVANIDLVAPPGSGVISGGGIVITGVPAEILLGTGQGVIQGPTARLTLDAPSGRPDVGVAGPVAAIALSAPAGSFSIVAHGVVANLNLVAPDGQAFIGAFVSAPAAQLLLQALAGSFTTTVTPPTPPNISLTAPAGGADTTASLYPVTAPLTFGGALQPRLHFQSKVVGAAVTSWRVELVGPTWHAYPPQPRWKARV